MPIKNIAVCFIFRESEISCHCYDVNCWFSYRDNGRSPENIEFLARLSEKIPSFLLNKGKSQNFCKFLSECGFNGRRFTGDVQDIFKVLLKIKENFSRAGFSDILYLEKTLDVAIAEWGNILQLSLQYQDETKNKSKNQCCTIL